MQCAQTYQLDYSAVKMCMNGTVGNELQHQMAKKTDQLDPPHNWVPWVTLNGVRITLIRGKRMVNIEFHSAVHI